MIPKKRVGIKCEYLVDALKKNIGKLDFGASHLEFLAHDAIEYIDELEAEIDRLESLDLAKELAKEKARADKIEHELKNLYRRL